MSFTGSFKTYDVYIKGSYWVGGTDAFSEGVWVWAKSMKKICDFTRWGPRQPSNSGHEEHCLEIKFETENNWTDNRCSYKEKYICEKELPV